MYTNIKLYVLSNGVIFLFCFGFLLVTLVRNKVKIFLICCYASSNEVAGLYLNHCVCPWVWIFFLDELVSWCVEPSQPQRITSGLVDISWTAQPFLTKLGMVVYYHEIECHVENLVGCLQGQGCSESSYNKNMTFCYIVYTAGSFGTKLCFILQHCKLESSS